MVIVFTKQLTISISTVSQHLNTIGHRKKLIYHQWRAIENIISTSNYSNNDSKQQELVKKSEPILLHDNANPHVSRQIQKILNGLCLERFQVKMLSQTNYLNMVVNGPYSSQHFLFKSSSTTTEFLVNFEPVSLSLWV